MLDRIVIQSVSRKAFDLNPWLPRFSYDTFLYRHRLASVQLFLGRRDPSLADGQTSEPPVGCWGDNSVSAFAQDASGHVGSRINDARPSGCLGSGQH